MPLTDSRHDMSGLLWDRDNDGVGMDSGMSQDEVEWHGGVVMRRHGLPWCQKLVVTRLLSCQCKPEQEERTTENHQMYQQGEQELERTEIVLGSHLLIVMRHTYM